MSYIYDTQVVYGSTVSNKDSFRLNGYHYYKTKTGISKKRSDGNKAVKVSNEEYGAAWEKYNFLFN